jgi:histidinol-phosphate aminotransferase
MALSRRKLLRGLGTGIVGAAAAPSLADSPINAGGVSWPTAGARSLRGPIRLHRNENPYGASRDVIAAMQKAALTVANRYPNVETEQLRRAIAARHRVTADQVVVGCGSSEILHAAAHAFLESRGKLVVASPTFDWFARYSQRPGTHVVAVPLTRDYSHDLDAMLARGGAAASLVYICNPNNPTGTLTRRQDLEAFVRKLPATTRVVIDEAYHHYVGPSADYASFLDRPLADARVIVTRSFSKIHGLAGLRIGYAIAAPETARLLRLHELPDNVNVLAAKAALIALHDDEHIRISLARTADDRQEFFNEANARMLRVIDSQTNFVMVNTGRSAAAVIEHFRKHNVALPRPFPGFDKSIRVSLGTPEDMRAFWRVWDLMPGGGHKM